MRASVDLTTGKANMATTYRNEIDFSASLPSPASFPSDWKFDGNTKFWFGGGPSASRRYATEITSLTIWNGYLPVVSYSSSLVYPGLLLLGHSRKKICNNGLVHNI